MNKYFKTLELDKILELLANEAPNTKTKEMAFQIEPVSDIDTVKREIQKTSDAFDLSVKFGTPSFYDINDITGALSMVKSGSVISLKSILQIGNVLSQINSLCDWRSHSENMENSLSYLFSRLMPNKYLHERIQNSIISEDEIADTASAELAAIRKKKVRAGAKVRETLDKMIKSVTVQKYLQDAIVTMRDGRYVLPVKSEHRGDVQGLIHDTSATGHTYFIEPISIVEANNDIRLLESQEQEEIERIIKSICEDCAQHADNITESYNVIAELCLYFSKANLAAKMKASLPEISDDGIIYLKKARHPLINKDKVVPVDITLGDTYQTLIITGPNTGGKTVALKTTGLLTAMVMCGLLIPVADGSKVSVFDKILVDIGDNQSIEQNLSTFSSHTNKVIEIIRTADEKTLILLDELGSGTDPVEGAALAVSIIERLKSQKAKMLVTTHYQELKLYAIEEPHVQNASFEFDIKNMQPTYKLIIGSPGKSNAFAISQSLGMPEDVIAYAESLVSSENMRFERVIEQLENTRCELDANNKEILRLKNEAEENAKKIKSQLDELDSKCEREMENARLRASTIIESTKVQSNELIDELEKIRKQKDKAGFSQQVSDAKSKTKNTFNKMYDTANPVMKKQQDDYKLPRALKKGDSVVVIDINKKGTVTDIIDKELVFVQIGIMKTKVNIKNIRLSDVDNIQFTISQKKKKGSVTQSVKSKIQRSGTMELDIRGYAADDGVYEMDAFIDSAVMSGLSTISIIHGKGTGILRQAIHNRLKNHPSVKSYRLGLFGEGENGVTIVELK